MPDDHAHEHGQGEMSYLNELPEARPHIHETRKFPDGFLWGAATSSHQVEGGNVRNDWSDWEQMIGHVLDGTTTKVATDHYRRYEEDFEMAKSLGHNAHRLSLEWSRIEPEEGKWDEAEIEHYRAVLEALRSRGMKVMLTAWHFTLPKWFAEKGGWEWKGAVPAFERFVRLAAERYGGLVDYWATINEPMIYLAQSYSAGIWPPGKKNLWTAYRVFHAMAKAHKRAYRAIHEICGKTAPVGFAQNVITFEPYRKGSVFDTLFVWLATTIMNHQFYKHTKRHHDYIGINYYFHYRVKYVPEKISQFFYEVHAENREVSDLGWEINPQGLFEALVSMSKYRRPIIVTEHGVANADDGKRPRMIVAGVKEMYHAIRSGVDVRGYFHWSLLDNFEWEKGLSGRFGLVAVDYETLKRTPRRSAYVFADICKENGLPHRLLRFVGHGVRW